MPVPRVDIIIEKNKGDYPFYMKWIITADIYHREIDDDCNEKLADCPHFDIIDVTKNKVVCLVNEDKNPQEIGKLLEIAILKCLPEDKDIDFRINLRHYNKF